MTGVAFVWHCLLALALAVQGGVDPELKGEFNDLAARATAAFEVVHNLEARLKSEGLTVHPDIRGRKVRVEMALDDAEEAIREGRTGDARKWLKRADGHLDRLEKALKGK